MRKFRLTEIRNGIPYAHHAVSKQRIAVVWELGERPHRRRGFRGLWHFLIPAVMRNDS